MEFISIGDVEKYLEGIPKFQIDSSEAADFNLRKFYDFCAVIGNPQEDFPSIHVGGTNGKGSSCKIMSAVYQRAGYEVGVYSSPHILRFNERFKINDRCISDEDLVDFFQNYYSLIEQYKLTYFEISTAIAFWWFAESEIDLGIIEVGLGGRLDATNIINPLVSVITSVALDHTDILGDSLEEVAREKAGIIKEGRPVVIGILQEEAEKVVREVAETQGNTVYTIDKFKPRLTSGKKLRLLVSGEKKVFDIPPIAPVQGRNIAVAYRVVQLLKSRFEVSESIFREAINELKLISARFEKLREDLKWYFDGGHNQEAVLALKEAVDNVGTVKGSILVLSLMRDKITSEVMNEFSEFKNIYYYTLNTKRAASFEDIKKWLPQVMKFPTHLDEQRRLLKEFNSELVIFAGSFYFYATVRDWIQELD